MTRNAAWQIHADDRGSLEIGKRADFAIVDQNPWTSDPAAWDAITVQQTFIDGEAAWEA